MIINLIILVSDACQINDFDHATNSITDRTSVSDACQINDFDHVTRGRMKWHKVSDACQINDFDHRTTRISLRA